MVGTSQEKIETHEYTNKDVHDWNTVEKSLYPLKSFHTLLIFNGSF